MFMFNVFYILVSVYWLRYVECFGGGDVTLANFTTPLMPGGGVLGQGDLYNNLAPHTYHCSIHIPYPSSLSLDHFFFLS